jgi:hypothetical protein
MQAWRDGRTAAPAEKADGKDCAMKHWTPGPFFLALAAAILLPALIIDCRGALAATQAGLKHRRPATPGRPQRPAPAARS